MGERSCIECGAMLKRLGSVCFDCLDDMNEEYEKGVAAERARIVAQVKAMGPEPLLQAVALLIEAGPVATDAKEPGDG